MRLQYTSCEERLRLLPRRDFGSRLKIKIFLIKLYNLIMICFDAFFFSFFLIMNLSCTHCLRKQLEYIRSPLHLGKVETYNNHACV